MRPLSSVLRPFARHHASCPSPQPQQWRCSSTALNRPSSASHDSLATFLAYASRTGLDPASTVYVGTRYEYRCQAALRALGFALTRCGGRADAGVDLYGTWTLPSQPQPLRVVVQCKALAAKVGPNLVRELEGAFAGAPAGWGGSEVVGVLCATREASRGVRDAVRRGGRGVVWVMVEDGREGRDNGQGDPKDDTGRIRQVVWNERVAELGATGVGVGVVYPGSGEEVQREVRLMWDGGIWTPAVAAPAIEEEDA